MFQARISPGERRTITLGALVSVVALSVAYGLLPYARRWRAREEVIAFETERLGRMRGLASAEGRLRKLLEERDAALEAGGVRLLADRTPALAASRLQSLIQGFAEQSLVTVSRLDFADAPDTGDGTLPMITVTVSGQGDIYGVTEMLSLIQDGSPLLEIGELSVRPNPALFGELLEMTLTLRAAYLGG